jgi:HEAT repeat protein
MSHSKSGDYYSAESQRGAAIAALILIRGDSMALCARKALDVHDPECNECRSAIVCLGANATPIVPILVDALQTSTNYWVKDYAANSLRYIHSRPDLSLPPLISMLRNTNSEMRSLAAFALEGFQDAAKPAWNDLVPLLKDPDETVRDNITNALRVIDSAAAKQLGVGPSKFE